MALGSARRALQPSARRGAGALWSCAPGRVREVPCRPRRVRIGVDNGSLGWAAGHWGSQFAYPNGWFPAPMWIAAPGKAAPEASRHVDGPPHSATGAARGGALHPFPNLPPPGPSGVGAAARAQGIGWRLRRPTWGRREGAPSTSLQWVRPLGLARCCVGWSRSLCAQPGAARKGGAPSATVPRCGRGGFAALRCCGPYGLVPVLRARGCGEGLCVRCVVGVCAASRSALRDPPVVAPLSASLRHLACRCTT